MTIQSGVDGVVGNDTLLLCDGTFTGPGNRDIDPGGKILFIPESRGSAGTPGGIAVYKSTQKL